MEPTHHIVRILGLVHCRATQLDALLDQLTRSLTMVDAVSVTTTRARTHLDAVHQGRYRTIDSGRLCCCCAGWACEQACAEADQRS